MSDDFELPEEEEQGQEWLATFADLMSLLMCFFVLLLSFSELDIQKYKQIAGSLRMAFGVQREVDVREPPKGTSLIKSEFTPGKPIPTPFRIINQPSGDEVNKRRIVERIRQEQEQGIGLLQQALASEIEGKLVDVLRINGEIVVRIQESESFTSGSASLRPTIYPILDRIIESLEHTSGRLVVSGHTDNIPINTKAYPSNWVLSSARAANVVHHLAMSDRFGSKQVEIRAYADTRPIRDNSTPENRAANRRVEIIVSPEEKIFEVQSVDTGPVLSTRADE